MAIVNSIKTWFPGAGQVTEYIALLAQNLPINATTSFAFTGFTNFVRSGRIRIKTVTAPAASQVTGIKITGTDGTLTVTLYQDTQARTAAELNDLFFDFLSELNLTTVTVAITAANAGTAQTLELELAGNP